MKLIFGNIIKLIFFHHYIKIFNENNILLKFKILYSFHIILAKTEIKFFSDLAEDWCDHHGLEREKSLQDQRVHLNERYDLQCHLNFELLHLNFYTSPLKYNQPIYITIKNIK